MIESSMQAFRSIQRRLGLSSAECPRGSVTKPFLFMSIDLEYSPKCITQLGISTFDIQTLALTDLERHISNEYPISSVLHSTKVSRYKERRRKRSHFGTRQILVPQQLESLLREILSPLDEQGRPREMALVGHSVLNDLQVVKDFSGLDVYHDIPSVKTILDTQDISQRLFRTRDPLSLRRLLLRLKLDYIGLHNAAHDSRYTLRALLFMLCMTAAQQHDSATPNRDWRTVERRFTVLEKIAKFHKPRERVTWCESSRVKYDGNTDLLDRDFDDSDDGLLVGFTQSDSD